MKLSLPALLLSLLLATPLMAHPGGHGGGYGGGYMPGPTPEPTPQPGTAIPDTYPEVVASLKEHAAAARTAIQAARIVDLHRSCDALKALAEAVPGKLGQAPDEARAAVQRAADNLASWVSLTVAKADDGNLKGAARALDRASEEIQTVEARGVAPTK